MKRPIPIACTLTESDLSERLAQWRSLVERAVEHNETADGVELVFRADVAPREIADLAIAELACCSFFTFTIALSADGTKLAIGAPPEARELAFSLASPTP